MSEKNALCMIDDFKNIIKDNRDIGKAEMRFLVDYYYQIQHYRIQANNQIRSLAESEQSIISFIGDSFENLENDIKKILDKATDKKEIGLWLKSICGVGPVISAGLISHLDIEKAPHSSSFIRFAGLDPTLEWKKGSIRPFNAKLKCLMWKLSESFVKVQNNEKDFYGKLYAKRKDQELRKNERMEFEETAKEILANKNFNKLTEAYKHYNSGKLPPAHINSRAQRYVKVIFLHHLWAIMYEDFYNKKPENPWIIEHGGHDTIIPIHNYDFYKSLKINDVDKQKNKE